MERKALPLDDRYLRCLAFVVIDHECSDGSAGRVPIGTAFLANVPFSDGTDRSFTYAVTAGHVVSRPGQYYLRINTLNGTTDVPVPQWFRHPVEDVAVASIQLDSDWQCVLIGPDIFADSDVQLIPRLGDRVYFIGLLDFLASRNVAMVRSGTIGKLNQERVPVEWDKTRSYLTVHLIDCRSYKGFSGSPCFIQAQVSEFRDMSKEIPGGMAGNVLFDKTLLLGLISGHFDQTEKANVEGDESLAVRARVNSGVGLVTPARFISETLEIDELAASRKATLANIRERDD